MKIRYPVRFESEPEIPDGDMKRYLLQHLLLDSDMMEASKPQDLKDLERELSQALDPGTFEKCMLYTRNYMRYLLDFMSARPSVKLEF